MRKRMEGCALLAFLDEIRDLEPRSGKTSATEFLKMLITYLKMVFTLSRIFQFPGTSVPGPQVPFLYRFGNFGFH
jgi:hypothetical protein